MLDGKEIAAKYMKLKESNPPREITVHEYLLPHDNILTPLGVAYHRSPFESSYLCMELAECSLCEYLHESKNEPSFEQSTKWALQIANGMQHLHKHHIIHRDLKSRNILVFATGDIKLCDFGCAKYLEETAHQTAVTGTLRWAAPEIHMRADANINKACDVFSYGMVLYELFMHQIPFHHIEVGNQVTQLLLEGKRPRISPKLPLYLQNLLQACWEHDPHHRPTFEEIVCALEDESFTHEIKTPQIPEPPHVPDEEPSMEPPDEEYDTDLPYWVGYFKLPIKGVKPQAQFHPNYQ